VWLIIAWLSSLIEVIREKIIRIETPELCNVPWVGVGDAFLDVFEAI
jgi:hypothetical protein